MSNFTQLFLFENVKIIEFRYNIWNRHEKRIQLSTNMPGIGFSNFCGLDIKILGFWEKLIDRVQIANDIIVKTLITFMYTSSRMIRHMGLVYCIKYLISRGTLFWESQYMPFTRRFNFANRKMLFGIINWDYQFSWGIHFCEIWSPREICEIKYTTK